MKVNKFSVAVALISASVSTSVLSMDLYVNTKTKQIYTEPGLDRELLGSFEKTGEATPVDRNVALKVKAEKAQLVGRVEGIEEKLQKSTVVKADENGLQLESADGNFKFKVGGRIHTDHSYSPGDKYTTTKSSGVRSDANDGTEIRRARIDLVGTIYQDWNFKSQLDFADNAVAIKDMYVGYSGLNKLGEAGGWGIDHIRIGNQKQAFSQEMLQSSNDLIFMERSLMNVLNGKMIDRAIGINALASGKGWTTQAGLYGGSPKTSTTSRDEGYGTSARVTFSPIEEKTRLIHFALAGNYRKPSGDGQVNDTATGVQLEYETTHMTDLLPMNKTITSVESIAMLGVEGNVVHGPVSVGGEYTSMWISRHNKTPYHFNAWYGEATLSLTGESRNYKKGVFMRLEPIQNFSFAQGGLGAFELVARVGGASLNNNALAGGEMKTVTAGLNWYVNKNVRFMVNYDKAISANGLLIDNMKKLNTVMMRAQLAF
ncbi:MAG: porin [Nitrosomonadaceae bacterium]|nr:porin [Nitrosomonadaceae bacterium]